MHKHHPCNREREGGAKELPRLEASTVGQCHVPPQKQSSVPLLLEQGLLPGRGSAPCRESVVSAVPNPKWLLRNCNPIKVLLVYLSSSGLFITVQMAATFARHSSVLARACRTEARAPQSLCLHLRGADRPPAPAPARGPLQDETQLPWRLHQPPARCVCPGHQHRASA